MTIFYAPFRIDFAGITIDATSGEYGIDLPHARAQRRLHRRMARWRRGRKKCRDTNRGRR